MADKKTNVKATGRKKAKIIGYYSLRWAPRKLRHMLRRNGEAFARQWAKEHNETMTLLKMLGKVV